MTKQISFHIMKRMLLFIILTCLISIAYDLRHMPFALRAWLPYPVDYLERLATLQGWPTEIGDGLNCSGFISNAHSSPFRKSYEVYANSLGDMELLSEVRDLNGIDESILKPGDIAAFLGPGSSHPLQRAGVHVIAYLGHGVWTGSDSRRGNVAKYRLSSKSASDPLFAGRVRLYRWKEEPKFSLTIPASTLGKDDRT